MRSMPPPADAEPAKLSWKTLKSLWPYLNEYRGRIVIAMMSLVAAKLATIVVPFILKYIVDGLDSNQLPDKVLA